MGEACGDEKGRACGSMCELSMGETFQCALEKVEIQFNAPNDQPTRLLVSERGSATGDRWLELPTCDQYGVAAAVFADAILNGRPLAIPLEDTLSNMRVIDAIFRSAQSDRWETI